MNFAESNEDNESVDIKKVQELTHNNQLEDEEKMINVGYGANSRRRSSLRHSDFPMTSNDNEQHNQSNSLINDQRLNPNVKTGSGSRRQSLDPNSIDLFIMMRNKNKRQSLCSGGFVIGLNKSQCSVVSLNLYGQSKHNPNQDRSRKSVIPLDKDIYNTPAKYERKRSKISNKDRIVSKIIMPAKYERKRSTISNKDRRVSKISMPSNSETDKESKRQKKIFKKYMSPNDINNHKKIEDVVDLKNKDIEKKNKRAKNINEKKYSFDVKQNNNMNHMFMSTEDKTNDSKYSAHNAIPTIEVNK